MKKLIAVFSLMAFLTVGALALNSISSELIALDSKADKVMVDQDPVKDGDNKDKKSSKTKTNAKKSSTKTDDCSVKYLGPQFACLVSDVDGTTLASYHAFGTFAPYS